MMEKLLKNKKLLLIIGGAIVAVIAIIVAIVLIVNNTGAKGAFGNYWTVMMEGKADKVESLAPQEFWDKLDKEMKIDIDDVIKSAEETLENRAEDWEDEYGKNYKMSYSVIREDKLDKDDIEGIAEYLEETYDIDADKVTDGVELDFCAEIKGSEDESISYGEMDVIKIDGKWYVINFSEYEGEYNVSFAASAFISYDY